MSATPEATPEQYRSTFALYGDGQSVMDDLQRIFGNAVFVAGQPDLTAYNCGAKAVIEHIWFQINKAEKPAQKGKS